MLLTPHILAGVAIGASTDNVYWIIILAILSHFLLDTIPHTDWGMWHDYKPFKLEKKDYILVICDSILSLTLLVYLWFNIELSPLMLIGGLSAILIDLIDNVPFWNKRIRKIGIFNKLHAFHNKINYKLKSKHWYWGVLSQLAIIGGTIWYLKEFLSL
jgi:hypothetical protein